jgi:hypothetical protein
MIKGINDVCEDPLNHWKGCVTASVSFLENATVNGISTAERQNANQSRNQSHPNLFLGPKAFPYQNCAGNGTWSYHVYEESVYIKGLI